MPALLPIEGTASQQRDLNRIVNAKTSSQREVFRARIILGLARGLSHEEIGKEQSVSLLAIGRWRKRCAARGLEAAQRCAGTGTQSAAFGQGGRTGPESGAYPGTARRALERARDGPANRAEQIECAAALGGPRAAAPPGARFQALPGPAVS